MSQHTPGPWTITANGPSPDMDPCYVFIDANDGWSALARVVVRLEGDAKNCPEGEANARLIAAAPKMLAALQSVISSRPLSIDFERNRTPEVLALRWKVIEAIEAATGGQS